MNSKKTFIRSVALATLCAAPHVSFALPHNFSFDHGVASGDPYSDSVVLWTRLTPSSSGSFEVSWEIDNQETFTSPEASGVVEGIDSGRDYTVKVIPTGLDADTTYFYRFTAPDGTRSVVGRTKTLPSGSTDEVRLAVFSCANITADYYSAYRKAAENGDYDALVHLGDWIYEYGEGGYAAAEDRKEALGDAFQPARELITLNDYRIRHAQYASDPDLQAARLSAPFITMWDDHETANDSYATGAENHSAGAPFAPNTLYVGAGSFDGSYYSFYSDEAGEQSIDLSGYVFVPGEHYEFIRLANAGGHPFYVSDNGYKGALQNVTVSGSGSVSSGIGPGESFTLALPYDFDGTLTYYCTAHSSMVANFDLRDAGEGVWESRVDRALQAYYEWMPIREPSEGVQRKSNYRSFDFGDLISLHMIETRLTARQKQLSYPTLAAIGARVTEIMSDSELLSSYQTNYQSVADSGSDQQVLAAALGHVVAIELAAQAVTDAYTDSSQTMIGATQMGWLQNEIVGSAAPWQVLGSQTLFGNMVLPSEIMLELAGGAVTDATVAKYANPIGKLALGIELSNEEQAAYSEGLASAIPYNLDAWDGYGFERETILGTVEALLPSGKNLVAIAGDTHNAWANELKSVVSGNAVGVEFATPAVSAPGIEKYFPGQEAILGSLFRGYSEGNKFNSLAERGFLDLTFTSDAVVARYYLESDSGREADWNVIEVSSSAASPTLTVGTSAADTEPDLRLIYASDLEGGDTAALDAAVNFAAIVDAQRDAVNNAIVLSAGDNFIPGPFFNAGGNSDIRSTLNDAYNTFYGLAADSQAPGTLAYEDLREASGSVDIAIMNVIGFDASAVGNHEFDAGTSTFFDAVSHYPRNEYLETDRGVGAQFPYLSANLDFTNESDLLSVYESDIVDVSNFGVSPSDAHVVSSKYAGYGSKHIAPAVTKTVNGITYGIIGLTTPNLDAITSAGNTLVSGTAGLTAYPTNEAERALQATALATIVNDVVSDLQNLSVDRIILISHLQQLELEQAIAPLVNEVDVFVAGGSGSDLTTTPEQVTNASGETAFIVSTPGAYSKVGVLDLSWDAEGNLTATGTGYDADADGVIAAGGSTTTGSAIVVQTLVDGVKSIVNELDTQIYGFTNVYLDGRREVVRTEESNFGNLAADAQLWMARQQDPSIQVSLKNGGGLRAPIGEIGGSSKNPTFVAPSAKTVAVDGYDKPAGAISQLDLENTLKFNNGLVKVEMTAADFRQIMEHAVDASGPGNTPGQFAQVAGFEFAFDYDTDQDANTEGSQRIASLVILDANGVASDVVVHDGVLQGDPNRTIRMVSMDFLVENNGDSYPFTGAEGVADSVADIFDSEGNQLKEQAAVAAYLAAFHGHPHVAITAVETAVSEDTRIQNLDQRINGLITDDADGDGLTDFEELITYSTAPALADSDGDGLSDGMEVGVSSHGFDANVANDVASLISGLRLAGQQDVVSDPANYELYEAPLSMLQVGDLILELSETATFDMALQESSDLTNWTNVTNGTVEGVSVDTTEARKFYRIRAIAE